MTANQIALKALAAEGICMSEAELLLRVVTALSGPKSRTWQGPASPSGRRCEPSIQTPVTAVPTGPLIATFCIVGIGVLAAVTILLAMALADDSGTGDAGNEDTGIYGEQ